MIYKFTLLNDKGIKKEFYLTADDEKGLYRRILDTYRIEPQRVDILEMFKETPDYRYEKVPLTYMGEKVSKKDKKAIDKSKELFIGAKKKRGQKKLDYIEKYGFKEISINNEEDLQKLLKKYKKVKCYFQPGQRRGTKEYYALVRN